MKTRVARVTVEKKVREHYFFEVPAHVSHEDVMTYVAEQELLSDCDIKPATTIIADETDGAVTFVGMPVDSPKAIPLDSDYTGWPPAFTPQVGQMIWWDDPDDGVCSGWYQIQSVDLDNSSIRAAPIGNPGGNTEMPFSEISLTGPVPQWVERSLR